MPALLCSILIGIVAGMRAMTAPAAVSWGARLGALPLAGGALAWLASPVAVGIFTVLAAVELVTDQLPTTPSRTVPVQFGTRLLAGALAGAAVAYPAGVWSLGFAAGVVGAIVGTLGGRAARGALARALGSDRPAAILEDLVAIGLAYLAVRGAA